jgi:hypothetical protein
LPVFEPVITKELPVCPCSFSQDKAHGATVRAGPAAHLADFPAHRPYRPGRNKFNEILDLPADFP